MKDFLIATGNPGKFREIAAILEEVPVTLRGLSDLGISTEFSEEGDTFESIARAKATHFANASKLPTLAEDSGIFVDALPGELGVRTRRWGAPYTGITDEEWITYFLHRMKDIPPAKRAARFVCAACIVYNNVPYFFMGQTRGFITQELQAPIHKGLPLSSCFVPEGCTTVYAALSLQEKEKVSHRGKALSHAKKFLLSHF